MFRSAFPFFRNNNLIYFDNAAMTQLPEVVIDRLTDFYKSENANIGRGSYPLANALHDEYEKTRCKVASFIGAASGDEIIFTPGCSYSINLLANSFVCSFVRRRPGKIIIGNLEHNSNYLVWKKLSEETGTDVEFFDYGELPDGDISFAAITASSNVVSSDFNLEHMISEIHKRGGLVLVDAAQLAGHREIDVSSLDCDFLAFSAHKMYSVAGCGVLYAKENYMHMFEPYLLGGGVVDGTAFKEAPYSMEVGTPNAASVIVLSSAIDFLASAGFDAIEKEEAELKRTLLAGLHKLDDIVILGRPGHSPIVSMCFNHANCTDVATLLADSGCAVRSGNQCSILAMKTLGIDECLRVSLSFYNTTDEVEAFVQRLGKILAFLRGCDA